MAQPVKMPAQIAEIEDHAPGLRSLILEPSRRVPRFKPGQFMHLAIDPYDPSSHWPESRCFSIASPPTERKSIRITVSAVGSFTRRVMNLRVGDQVWIKLPYGEFVVPKDSDRPVVLVAGGTGITPCVSLLTSRDTTDMKLQVFYGVRSPDLLIYVGAIEEAKLHWPNLEAHIFVEDGPLPKAAHRGKLNAEAAFDAGGPDAAYYLAGPPAMINTFKTVLHAHGIAQSQLFLDAWT